MGFLSDLFGWFGGIHGIIALIAIIDIIRSKSPWYWFWVVLFFPMIGAIAYFVIERAPWGNNPLALPVNVSAQKKRDAKRKLQELEARATSWRGPGLLAEIGEHYLILDRYQEAHAYLAEAYENEKDDIHLTYHLAQAKVALGMCAEALPLLESVCSEKADFAFGHAILLLGRCQQETGNLEGAEEAMRTCLKRHAFFEARYRLAALLAQKGEQDEARQILTKMLNEWQTVPPKLRRAQKSWISQARKLLGELGQ